MPNWCENTLRVKGPAEDINKFQMACRNKDGHESEHTELSLQRLWPCPPSILNNQPVYGDLKASLAKLHEEPLSWEQDDWYSWRVRNWGTKWDVKASIKRVDIFKNGNKEIIYDFNSAWNAPCEAFKKICEDWPTLTFKLRYRGEGSSESGVDTFKAEAVDRNSAI